MKKYNTFLTILICYILVSMLLAPQKFLSVTYNGISAWALNVLPCILPFIFFTKLLSKSSSNTLTSPFASIFHKTFKTSSSSAYVFFMAIISGYPVGAKMISDLYMEGRISRTDAYRMTSFCSTSGPMFIVGSVGALMFNNIRIGYFILIAHILGAIINGICYRNLSAKDIGQAGQDNSRSPFNFSEIVIDSVLSILSVGVIIAIFFVVITAFEPIFNLFPAPIKQLLQGCVEITKGCLELSKLKNIKLSFILTTFVISFGGFSTILQSITFLEKIKMPTGIFILQKLTHGIFSMLIAFFLSFLL